MRPDDIHCIDTSQSKIVEGNLEVVVLFPKERRSKQRIIKTTKVWHHSVPELCPVKTYNVYRIRTSSFDKKMAHPKDRNTRFTPLMRNCQDLSLPISTDRISNHMQSVSQFIPSWDDSQKLKARAIGATMALRNGVSVDDVMVQGNWSSTDIVNEFYRLSRSTALNFTTS
ncbi:hypothetical protein BGZ80_008981, partial [Entomortierella chlamydospora]